MRDSIGRARIGAGYRANRLTVSLGALAVRGVFLRAEIELTF